MKHDLVRDERGRVDYFQLDLDMHNGPRCMRCEATWCRHCDPWQEEEECPAGQLSVLDAINELYGGGGAR